MRLLGPDLALAGPKRSSRTSPQCFWRWRLMRPPRDWAWAGGEVHAGVYCGFIVGGGFGEDELFRQVEELRLLAAGSGEEGTHGDGGGAVCSSWGMSRAPS